MTSVTRKKQAARAELCMDTIKLREDAELAVDSGEPLEVAVALVNAIDGRAVQPRDRVSLRRCWRAVTVRAAAEFLGERGLLCWVGRLPPEGHRAPVGVGRRRVVGVGRLPSASVRRAWTRGLSRRRILKSYMHAVRHGAVMLLGKTAVGICRGSVSRG